LAGVLQLQLGSPIQVQGKRREIDRDLSPGRIRDAQTSPQILMSRIASPIPADESIGKVLFKKRIGKVEQWNQIRRVLKVRFQAVGIIRCELGYRPFCVRDNFLGFAHCKKRRNCSEADLWIAVLACSACHDCIEILPESEMGAEVLEVIAAREKQP